MEIEVFCSDLAEHECRVRERLPEISGFRLPSWKDVIDREYEQWPEAKLRIDTTRLSPKEAVDIILQKQQQFDLTK
ncbi:MAG: hypothetical protein PWP23_3092 [Candidatus Sumerlaeota bacterium]|nr:hypothetical protein [Candidatus Sumerlaeota bacterium]